MDDPSHSLSFLRGTAAATLLLWVLGFTVPTLAQEEHAATPPAPAPAEASQAVAPHPDAEPPSAPVEIDGTVLFRVRGDTAFPAETRAEGIAGRIKALAADTSVPVDPMSTVEVGAGTRILAGNRGIMTVTDADARMESIDRQFMVGSCARAIRQAVVDYRQARSRPALIHSGVLSAVATAILAVLLAFVLWLSRWLLAAVERRYRQRIQAVDIQSFQIVRAEHIWGAVRRTLKGTRAVVILVTAFIYLEYVLGLFPWTRAIANRQLGYVLDPLRSMGWGIANAIPGLIFLAILWLVTRYLLKLINLFFGAVGRGEVALSGFHREWAEPTYKLMRLGVVAFALVVAYPYIPGSHSDAFKGISLFIGIVFSLGSSSAISNMIAGYMMTYRRAFKVGDRVKIGETTGDVTQMRLQVTHLKTIWNEEVTVPNSEILENEVVNYSSLARSEGLILHTTVSVGYQVPWRQVEALLLMAADRTPGLLKQPPPFVLQPTLGAFAVSYELDIYCDNAQAMEEVYAGLHRNIMDLFNEYGVQIMTPAYQDDPEERKVVPKGQWFAAPAKRGPDQG